MMMMMMMTTMPPPRAGDENAPKRFSSPSSRFSYNCCCNISTQPTSLTPNNA